MDFLRLLNRYEGRRVSVVAGESTRLLGTLASVSDEAVRLTQVQISDPLESGGWLDQLQLGSGEHLSGPCWPEMIIPGHYVRTVCCLDDDILDVPVSEPASLPATTSPPPSPSEILSYDLIQLELGYGLVKMVDTHAGGDLLDRVRRCRDVLTRELGFPLPRIRILDRVQLQLHAFRITVHGAKVLEGEVQPGQLLAIETRHVTHPIVGQHAIEPAFGLSGWWIDPQDKSSAELTGYTVVEPTAVLCTALSEAIRRNAAELFTYDALHSMLNQLRDAYPTTVETLVPAVISIPLLHRVLRELLADRVSLAPLARILNSLGDHVSAGVRDEELAARVRLDLARPLCEPYLSDDRQLAVISLDADLLGMLPKMIAHAADATARCWWQRLAERLKTQLRSERKSGQWVVCVPAEMRIPLRNVLRGLCPELILLATNEIPMDIPLDPVVVLREADFDSATTDETDGDDGHSTSLPNLPR